MLEKSKALSEFAKEHKGIFEKIKENVEKFLSKIRDAVKALYGNERADVRSVAHELEAYADEMQEIFDKALRNTLEASAATVDRSVQSNAKEKAPAPVGEVQYSKNYAKAKVNQELLDFVLSVENGNEKPNKKYVFGEIDDATLQTIKKLTGIDVSGFSVAIEARQIEHILKDHGKNGKTDRSMADYSDIAKVEYVMDSPDNITSAGKTQAYSYMKHGYNRTASTILLEKVIGDKSYFVVEAVPDSKAKTIYIVTAYIGLNGQKKKASQLINASSPNATPKSGSVVTFNNSVSNINEKVNTNLQNSHPNDSEQHRRKRKSLVEMLQSEAMTQYEKEILAGYAESEDDLSAMKTELDVTAQILNNIRYIPYEAKVKSELSEVRESLKDARRELREAEKSDRIIYEKTEEPTQGMPQVQYERDINADSSTDSISESGEIVNSVEQENSGDGTKAVQKADSVEEVSSAKASVKAAEPTYVEAVDGDSVSLEAASKKYGAQAGAMMAVYSQGQDIAKFDSEFRTAYNMGLAGVPLSYIMNSSAFSYLSETQKERAWGIGEGAAEFAARTKNGSIKKSSKEIARKKGIVRGEGVDIDELRRSFNDTQKVAYRLLLGYAEATGINIVLYKSEADAEGRYTDSQGKFVHSEDTIYIDINAGINKAFDVDQLSRYTMMRTFSHEFVHFCEKWNPIQYNEFRRLVFDRMVAQGVDVDELILEKQALYGDISYEKASREVVAEAMADILPDSSFMEELSQKHKNIFTKLIEKLKEFLSTLKAHFRSLTKSTDRGAAALKEQVGNDVRYFEDIVKAYDKMALDAVENYQAADTKKAAENGGVQEQIRYTTDNVPVVIVTDDILQGVPKADWVDTVKNTISTKFSKGIPISGRLIKVNLTTKNEFTNSKNSKHYRRYDRQIYRDKYRSANNLDEIVLASTNYVNEDLNHKRKDSIVEFARGDVLMRIGTNDYSAKVVVGFTSGKNMVLYDIVDFNKASFQLKKVGTHTAQTQNVQSSRTSVPTGNSISKSVSIVNSNTQNTVSSTASASQTDQSADPEDGGVQEQRRDNSEYSEYDKPITFEDVKLLRSIIGAHNGQRVSINDFTSEDIQNAQKWAYKFYKELGVKSPFFRAWFGDWREFDTKTEVKFVDTIRDNRKSVINKYTGWDIQTSKKVHKETSHHSGSPEVTAVKYLPYIDDITEKAVLFDSIISDKDNENSLMFHTMYAYTEILGYPALLKIKVEELFYHNRETSGILKRDYILQNIEEESISKRNRFSRPNHSETNSSVISISDLFSLVKQYDKEFNPKAVNKFLLEKGEPRKFYHGTNSEFFEFDLEKSGANYGDTSEGLLFFTSKKGAYPDSATDYARDITKKKGGKETVREVYVSMQNPLVLDSRGYYTTQAYFDQNHEDIYNKYLSGDYDGIIIHNSDKSADDAVLAIVDNAGQAKSATYSKDLSGPTDNIGTFDRGQKDIRYQRRTDALSDREILYRAATSIDTLELSEGERSALDIFKKHLDELEDRERAKKCRVITEAAKKINSRLLSKVDSPCSDVTKLHMWFCSQCAP